MPLELTPRQKEHIFDMIREVFDVVMKHLKNIIWPEDKDTITAALKAASDKAIADAKATTAPVTPGASLVSLTPSPTPAPEPKPP